MIQSIRMSRRSQLGQGMTEYIIIVALIAIAAIGVYSFFGQTIRGQTAGMAAEMSGGSATAGQAAAKTASTAAQGQTTQKSLGTYGGAQK
jgi:Flp pilus assembly pilin Flp